MGTSGFVRASSMPQLERCATVVQTFWPFTIQSSPSRTARVARPATSEPALGSLNIWHQMSSPEKIRGSRRFFCSSLRVGEHGGRAHADADRGRGRIAVHDLRVPRDLVVHDRAASWAAGRARRGLPGKCTHARPCSNCLRRNVTLSLRSGWISASSARVRSRSSASLIVRYSAMAGLRRAAWVRSGRRRTSGARPS